MSPGGRSPHADPLERLVPRPPADALERLVRYLDTLAEWNSRVNLTGARTPEERVARLVSAVWPLVERVRTGRLIDVGSGNGSPGLVLALVRDDLAATLLEPRARRWAFLREAARRAGRPVEVLRARHDGYRGAPARTVTVRALALPPEELVPLVEPGGSLFVVGARPGPPGLLAEDPSASSPRHEIWALRRP